MGRTMSRPIASSLLRVHIAALCLSLIATALLFSPDPSPADEPGEDTPPVITNGILAPSFLFYEGGAVSISVDVTDDVGVTSVYAEIVGSDGSNQGVGLESTGGMSYSTNISIPPNYSEGEVWYSVWVWASDTNKSFSSQLIGEIQVNALPQFDEPPSVWEPSVSPHQLPPTGGPVTIQASASDNRAISEVYAAITFPDGTITQVQLEPISSTRYEGVFTAPANAKSTPEQYGIEVTALDDIGQPASADAGSFSVAAQPQASGRLAVRPGTRYFGRVMLGTQSRRLLVVRNKGPRSSKPIEGLIQTSGAPFSLPGGATNGIRFRLGPGQVGIYVIEFRPTAVGSQTGSLSIVRSDGDQPGLGVQLSGQGVKRR
jgi:hypothetical protein